MAHRRLHSPRPTVRLPRTAPRPGVRRRPRLRLRARLRRAAVRRVRAGEDEHARRHLDDRLDRRLHLDPSVHRFTRGRDHGPHLAAPDRHDR